MLKKMCLRCNITGRGVYLNHVYKDVQCTKKNIYIFNYLMQEFIKNFVYIQYIRY